MMGSNPSYFNGDRSGPPDNDQDYGIDLTRPVEQVSWHDATNYCARLTAQERIAGRIPTNYVYRPPTEAEWEFACRAGTATRFHYGDDPGYTNLTNYAWYFDNSDRMTQPVGQLLPNAWGLVRHGWERVGVVSGLVWRISRRECDASARGGYGHETRLARHCRAAWRFNDLPANTYSGLGFRVVLASGQP